MSDHLSDDELGRWVVDPSPPLRDHVAACPECRARLESFARCEAALNRLGREARTVTHPDAASAWARVRSELPALAARRPVPARAFAWSMALVAGLLLFGLAVPLFLQTGGIHQATPGASLAPAWAHAPESTPAAPHTLVYGETQPATASAAPATLPEESTTVSQLTISPEPVPMAPSGAGTADGKPTP